MHPRASAGSPPSSVRSRLRASSCSWRWTSSGRTLHRSACSPPRSRPDVHERNRVTVIERQYEVLLNWVHELAARALAEGQRLGVVDRSPGHPWERLAALGVITHESAERLQQAKELRDILAHAYPPANWTTLRRWPSRLSPCGRGSRAHVLTHSLPATPRHASHASDALAFSSDSGRARARPRGDGCSSSMSTTSWITWCSCSPFRMRDRLSLPHLRG